MSFIEYGNKLRGLLHDLRAARGLSRREVFRAGGITMTAGLFSRWPAIAATKTRSRTENLYTRIGVRPFINLTATYTINGGLLTLPRVKQAVEEASHYSVNIDELMEKVGERLSRLLGCETAIVTSGCSAALTLATAACMTGGDPEKIAQLPSLARLKSEVIMPVQSRTVYDHSIRAVGARIINVDTREQLDAALSDQTAMIAVLGEEEGRIRAAMRLEEVSEAARKIGVTILVDAAAGWPSVPNPYLTRGADLVAYSGGKLLHGPQCAGILLGRKDLVRAAWANSAPHDGFGRGMKVGKEEIMGLLAAVEALMQDRDYEEEKRAFESWLSYIGQKLSQLSGVHAKLLPQSGANPFQVLEVEWDPRKIDLTASKLHSLLLDGEPRIMSHAAGDGHSFIIRAQAMKPGDQKVVADRLNQIFKDALSKGDKTSLAPAGLNVAGRWDVDVQYPVGAARHTFVLEMAGNRLTGLHSARFSKGQLSGIIDGNRIQIQSVLAADGFRLSCAFDGHIVEDRMVGEVDLADASFARYGRAGWTAVRQS